MGEHACAEHVGRVFDRVRGSGCEFDATGLAAASGVDLGFDDYGGAEIVGGGGDFVRAFHDAPRQDWDAVFGEELLGLILVEVHSSRVLFVGCVAVL